MKKTKKDKTSIIFSDNTIITGVLILSTILLYFVFNPVMFTGGDNAQYIALANSLHKCQYRDIVKINHPPETAIGPGYPLMISPLILLWPNSIIPLKILSFILMLLAVFFIMKFFQQHNIPLLAGGFFTLALIANPIFNEFSHWCLSDGPFMATIFIAIYLFERYWKTESLIKFIIISAPLSFNMYLRPVAAPFLAGAFIFLMILKEWKKASILLTTGSAIYLPWLIRNRLVQTSTDIYMVQFLYDDYYGERKLLGILDYLTRAWQNFTCYALRDIPKGFFRASTNNIDTGVMIGYILVAVVLIGIFISIFEKKSFLPYASLLFAGMLAIWNPKFATFRFVMPLIPVLFLFIWKAFSIQNPIDLKKHRKLIITIIALLSLLLSIPQYSKEAIVNTQLRKAFLSGNKYAGIHPSFISFFRANEWIKANTPKNAVIISRKPTFTYLFADRTTHVYRMIENPAIIMSEIDSIGADYVLIDRISGTTQAYLIPAIQAYPHRFQLVHQTQEPATYVMKVLPPEPPRQEIPATPEERNN